MVMANTNISSCFTSSNSRFILFIKFAILHKSLQSLNAARQIKNNQYNCILTGNSFLYHIVNFSKQKIHA